MKESSFWLLETWTWIYCNQKRARPYLVPFCEQNQNRKALVSEDPKKDLFRITRLVLAMNRRRPFSCTKSINVIIKTTTVNNSTKNALMRPFKSFFFQLQWPYSFPILTSSFHCPGPSACPPSRSSRRPCSTVLLDTRVNKWSFWYDATFCFSLRPFYDLFK